MKKKKKNSLELKSKYDLKITTSKVDSYSFVQVDKNKYSVPDYLVGNTVIIRIYEK